MYKKLLLSLCAVTIMHASENGRVQVNELSPLFANRGSQAEERRGVAWLAPHDSQGRLVKTVNGCSIGFPEYRRESVDRSASEESEDRAENNSPTNQVYRYRRLEPQRCWQALAAIIICPLIAADACCASDDGEDYRMHNSCYDHYIAPFKLTEKYSLNTCCVCLFDFCPCCVPQEADLNSASYYEQSVLRMHE